MYQLQIPAFKISYTQYFVVFLSITRQMPDNDRFCLLFLQFLIPYSYQYWILLVYVNDATVKQTVNK